MRPEMGTASSTVPRAPRAVQVDRKEPQQSRAGHSGRAAPHSEALLFLLS